GDRNIDRSKYGEMLDLDDKPGELLLPLSQEIEYDGRRYISDAHGYYIERSGVESDAVKEDSLDCSEIYPSRIGKCTEWITVDKDKNLYDFVDNTIPANLDFNSYLIAGETMTIIFQSGMLSGNDREFEVKYYHNSVNGKKARRFEIVPQEIDGVTMPNETFKPKFGDDGDTYIVVGIQLPKEYICNNEDKTGASWDMMREAARKMRECEDQKFTFTGELQAKWARENWEDVGAQLVVGGYVRFTDNQFAKDPGVDIRIVGIKDYLTNPYAPTIELSNAIISPGSVNSSLQKIDDTEVVIDDVKESILRFTKRRFRDALETIGMLEDAQLANFSGAITPVAIQTMAMLVGDESLQFLMGYTLEGIGKDAWGITYDNDAGELRIPFGFLRHMTIGIDAITAENNVDARPCWRMPISNKKPQSGEKYYLYAKVRREGMQYNNTYGGYVNVNPGEWVLDTNSHKIDEDPAYYYLLTGILNSEYLGERSFATMYGFTEILPGQITTDVVRDTSGESYFDLAQNRFKLGDKLGFNVDNDGVLRLRGAMVQSSSGDEMPLPCFRGTFDISARYYRGDLVSYTSGGNTSSYICITTATGGIVGISPASTAYWKVYAQGTTGQPGTPGAAGLNAPILVFRGNYDPDATYYGNLSRVDAVKFGSQYYVAQMTAPDGTTGFTNIEPGTDADYWKSFGASFESVATSLLLAENATIGNWFISGDNIVSTHGTINGVESNDYTDANFRPDVVLDGATGEVVMYSGKYPRVRLSNQSVKDLFNESLLSEATINRQISKVLSPYIPYSSGIYKSSVGLLGTHSIGQMNEDSEITITRFLVSFYVPGNRNDSQNKVSVVAFVNGSDMIVNIKRDGVTVKTFTGGSGVNCSKGNYLSHDGYSSTSAYIYKVPSGGAGNYTLEFRLKEIGWTASHSGELSTFTLNASIMGSYKHGGFNRTVIGNDGFGSFWENSAFVFSTDKLVAKFGKIGFRISASGIEKTDNYTTEEPHWTKM
ncbi:MAG: phage tail protein, partial [Ruminococcus sp.]|nr:phage tail protein [Ruminococcus sp.]